jgi:hypothetical protein
LDRVGDLVKPVLVDYLAEWDSAQCEVRDDVLKIITRSASIIIGIACSMADTVHDVVGPRVVAGCGADQQPAWRIIHAEVPELVVIVGAWRRSRVAAFGIPHVDVRLRIVVKS